MRVVFDIEANGLENANRIWLIVCKNIDTGELYIFREEDREAFKIFIPRVTLWIGHNILGYDWPVLVSVWGCTHPTITNVIDTLVCSKLSDYSRDGHSIEQYGLEFGYPKLEYSDFSRYTPEMEEYCVRDVEICHKVYLKYLKYINNPDYRSAIELEHKFQLIVNDLHNNGFAFDAPRASKLLEKVQSNLSELDKDILEEFPPRLKLVKEIHPRETKHGTLHKSDFRWVTDGDLSVFNGGSFCRCAWMDFNPSSHKQIIDVLNEAGWQPTEKTKTHIDTERQLRRRDTDPKLIPDLKIKLIDLQKTGWKVTDHNLNTLPNYEDLELWKDKCRIKIDKDNQITLKNIIGRTLSPSEKLPERITIKTQKLTEIGDSLGFMGLLQATLMGLLPNKKGVVEFVESQNSLWSIIVTPQEMFVDCSASFATDTWDGLRNIQALQKTISKLRAARTLAKRIMLESRRRTLVEWLSLVKADGRIHGRFNGLGAWTHRMNHQNPNTANIPTEAKLFGKEMRQLWIAPKNRLLVGVDAEGIQLRIFAHYINDEEFTDALVRGRKDDKTDPHSLNQRILGHVCKGRQIAKRFIYALLLGAGIDKLTEILGSSRTECQEALNRLLERYTGFAHLKETVIPKDAKRGCFIGLDGRAVRLPGETEGSKRHLCMSGYLQNGEAIVMKKACSKFSPLLSQYNAFLVDFVHDEYITECPNDFKIAKEIAIMKAEAIKEAGEFYNLKCPLAGSYFNEDTKDFTIGTTWYATH